jgi:CARDB protein
MRYLLPFKKKLYATISLIIIFTIIPTCSQSGSDPGTIPDNGSNSGLIDLYPGLIDLTNSGDKYAADGTVVSITLPIQNLGADDVVPAPSFNVQFYLSEDENLGMDHILEEISVGVTISGSGTYNLVTNVTIPDDLDLNQCVYIWADVDNSDLISPEIDEGNNQSSISSALCLLVYNDDVGGRSYEMVFETFAPTGTDPIPVPNLVLNLYYSSGVAVPDGQSSAGNYSKIVRTGGNALNTGTYYLKVDKFAAGAYGLSVRSSETMPIPYFTSALALEGDDPYEPDDVDTGNDNTPDSPVTLRVGSALNRYIGAADIDWMEIVLP